MFVGALTTGLLHAVPVLDRNCQERMIVMWKSFRVFAALGVASLLVAVTVQAQVSTSGQIRGRVVDEAGAAVQAVVVVARNVDTGLERQTSSSERGDYVVRMLPPGSYNLTTRAIGFQPGNVANVHISVGSSPIMNFTLSRAIQLAAIEITAVQDAIDMGDGGVKQLVTQQEIQGLPSLGRDFVDFINLSGLVAEDQGQTTGGQFSIGGQNPSQTNVTIDGVDANNSFFGENRGGARIPFVFSLESIREFQIITNGFDVEYGRFSGGIVNVVTKGGTNRFEGSVYGNFRNDALTAQPFINDPNDAELTTDYEVQQFGGHISGAFIQNKLFFNFAVDAQRRREPQNPLTQAQFAPGGTNEDALVFGEIDQYFTIIESQYGVANPAAGYQAFNTTADNVTAFARLDWNMNNDHRLSVRFNFAAFENDNEWNGTFDNQYGLSRAEKFESKARSIVAELTSQLGANTFNVFRFQVSREERPRQGKDLRPTLTVNLSNGQRIRYGGTFASYNNTLEEDKVELINNFTHVSGSHTFKLGAQLLRTHDFNRFQNFGSQFQGAGEYIFANLTDFQAFRPSSYYRPIQQGGGIPIADFDVVDWAVYLQDSWQMSYKLKVILGLRYDQKSFRQSPTPVIDIERAFGFTTGFAPTDNNNISPRLSLAYDLHGDGTTVLRAGVGYFFGRLPNVVGGNVLSTQRPVVEIFCAGSVLDGDPDAPPSPADYGTWAIDGSTSPEGCASTEAGGVPTYTFWNDNFQVPEILKGNVGLETFLGDRSRFSIDFLYTIATNGFTVRNLNLRDSQFNLAGEFQRRVFTPSGQFDPTSANVGGSIRNTEFGQVLVNFNDGRARSFVGTAALKHNLSDAINFSLSYTFTKAEDNSNYDCCTAAGGYAGPTTGVFGPNEIGGFGDTDNAWGRSSFQRTHALVFTAFVDLPAGFKMSAFWKSQSGRPWTVRGDDDLNGDGITGNDRTFIFAPANLPLASSGTAADDERALYTSLLQEFSCAGDFQGRIVERNSCRFPWTHNLTMRLSWSTPSFIGGRRFEFDADFFNVLNGIGRLLCDEDAADVDFFSGACGLGRVTGVFGSNRELLDPRGFDSSTGEIRYAVNSNFGRERLLGSNLVLQFQLQLSARLFF